MRKCNKKLEAARKTLEHLHAKTVELEEKRKEACAELTRAQHGAVATRLASPTLQEMDIDEPKQHWPKQGLGQLQKRRKTNSSECDASARAN